MMNNKQRNTKHSKAVKPINKCVRITDDHNDDIPVVSLHAHVLQQSSSSSSDTKRAYCGLHGSVAGGSAGTAGQFGRQLRAGLWENSIMRIMEWNWVRFAIIIGWRTVKTYSTFPSSQKQCKSQPEMLLGISDQLSNVRPLYSHEPLLTPVSDYQKRYL